MAIVRIFLILFYYDDNFTVSKHIIAFHMSYSSDCIWEAMVLLRWIFLYVTHRHLLSEALSFPCKYNAVYPFWFVLNYFFQEQGQ